jgi:hypothetical protein
MRRVLILLLAVIVVLAVAHTLLWRWAVQRMESEFANWVTEERAQGWTVTSGEPLAGGWPLAAQLTVPSLSITGGAADIPGGLAWRADCVVVGVALAHPRLLTMDVNGTQRLRFSVAPQVSGVADRFRVTIPLDPGAPPRAANLDATNLHLGPSSEGLTIALLGGRAEVNPGATKNQPAVTVSASAEDIALPPGDASALGPRLASVALQAALDGPLPSTPGLVARAAAWRDGGGALEIRQLTAGWGPLGVNGRATLALDGHLQPTGTASAQFLGYAEALDALAANHAISTHAAQAAKAVLGLMARPDGERSEVEVPLTLKDRTLSVGQIPLAHLPGLVWPDAP